MRISVIIPTLNESATIVTSLKRLRAQEADEVIVADASSGDGTAELARAEGVLVIDCPRGRGIQQNRGAAAATGEILLFLHADCGLEPGAIAGLRLFMGRHPKVPGGCFRMRVDSAHPLFRTIDLAADLRAGLIGIPYGDQGIFLRRSFFDSLGGFPEIPIMEDVYMSLQLRRSGRVAVLPHRILVSPRRWTHRGILRQTLRNWLLTAAAALGVSTRTLSRFYPDVR
jgi:rSAM/selenodomain-associated transferase 2